MGRNRNKMRLAIAAITTVTLGGGVMVAQAATFPEVANSGAPTQDLSQSAGPALGWPAIAPTCVANCSINLFAGHGVVTVADTATVTGTQDVPVLGFRVGGAATDPVGLAGSPASTIKVPVGTTLTITVTQDSDIDAPKLSFPSLPAGSVVETSPGVFQVNANTVGTSVFQPGTNAGAPREIAQGLVGVLIVTPADCTGPNLTCAYAGTPTTSYADEALVATTDLDLDFANNPASYDMSYFGQAPTDKGTPRKVYHVINGKSFPDTQVIDAKAGDAVLLRYVNAGVTDKTMGLLGLRQTLLARNASQYKDPQTFIAPMVGPGETADVVVGVPSSAAAGQRYSLMDQGRQMNHGTGTGFGGALTFINVWAGTPANPTIDSLTAVAGVSTPAQVTVGNPLVDRAFATDYPTPIGTLSPVLVALTASPLSAGTLQSFETWNQATAGGSPTPSAGGLLHAYVLRPTVNANEYDVIYDSGEVTVPALSGVISEAVSFPTTGVPVLAGDVIAFFGQGVPVDVGGGSDVLVFDPSTPVVAPADGDIITLGAGGYPIYSTDRTYSFAATVAPAPTYTGSTTLTATGHSSGAQLNITGYQTVVNAGATPAAGDWSATTSIAVPAATVPITTTVSAVPGQTVWIRVQQEATIWSNPASIVVPVP